MSKIEQNIRGCNHLPGTERYTSPEEIESLKKYLKKGIEKRDSWLEIEKDNLENPKDPRYPDDPKLSENALGLEDRRVLDRLGDKRLGIEKNQDLPLSQTRVGGLVEEEKALESESLKIQDHRENELLEGYEGLETGKEIKELEETRLGIKSNENPGSLDDSLLGLEDDRENNLSLVSLEIQDDKKSQALSEAQGLLRGEKLETIKGNDDVSEIPDKNIELEKGSEIWKLSEEALGGPEKNDLPRLSEEVLGIKRPEDQKLSEKSLEIKKPDDQSLSKKSLGIKKEENLELSQELLEIKKPGDLELSEESLGIEEKKVESLPEFPLEGPEKNEPGKLVEEALRITPKETPELYETPKVLEDQRENQLEEGFKSIKPKETTGLSEEVLGIKKKADQELSETALEIKDPRTNELSEEVLGIKGNQEKDLEEGFLEIEEKKIKQLSEHFDGLEDKREIKLEEDFLGIKDKKEPELSEHLEGISNQKNPQLSKDTKELEDRRKPELSESYTPLLDKRENKLEEEALGIKEKTIDSLSDIFSLLEDKREPELSEDLKTIHREEEPELIEEVQGLEGVVEKSLEETIIPVPVGKEFEELDSLKIDNPIELSGEYKDVSLSETIIKEPREKEVNLGTFIANRPGESERNTDELTDERLSSYSKSKASELDWLNLDPENKNKLSQIKELLGEMGPWGEKVEVYLTSLLSGTVGNFIPESKTDAYKSLFTVLPDYSQGIQKDDLKLTEKEVELERDEDEIYKLEGKEVELFTDTVKEPSEREVELFTDTIKEPTEKEVELFTDTIKEPTEREVELFTDTIKEPSEKEVELFNDTIKEPSEREVELFTDTIKEPSEKSVELFTDTIKEPSEKEVSLFTDTIKEPSEKEVSLFTDTIKEPSEKSVELFTDTIKEPSEKSVELFTDTIKEPSEKSVELFTDTIKEPSEKSVELFTDTIKEPSERTVGLSDKVIKEPSEVSVPLAEDLLYYLPENQQPLEGKQINDHIDNFGVDEDDLPDILEKRSKRLLKEVPRNQQPLGGKAINPEKDNPGGIDESDWAIINSKRSLRVLEGVNDKTSNKQDIEVAKTQRDILGTPVYKLPSINLITGGLNVSDFIRWVAENTVGNIPLHGATKAKLLDETLAMLTETRDLLEKATGARRFRLPGNTSAVAGLINGGLSVQNVVKTAASLLSSDTKKKPYNRPEAEKAAGLFGSSGTPKPQKEWGAPGQVVRDNNLDREDGKGGGSFLKKIAKNIVDNALGKTDIPESEKRKFARDYLNDISTIDSLGDNIGIEVSKNFLFPTWAKGATTLEDLMKEARKSSKLTTPEKFTSTKFGRQYTTLDSNHVWEIHIIPYLGKHNNYVTFLPSLAEIDVENKVAFNISTNYASGWIPITGYELQSRKMTSKEVQLHNGNIYIPLGMELTNELRLSIADDSLKSMRRYFELSTKSSIYMSSPHKQLGWGDVDKKRKGDLIQQAIDEPTVILDEKVHPAPYKNVAFLITIFILSPQLAVIKRCRLLCILKDFMFEYQGETDAAPTELSVVFSIVGENPIDGGAVNSGDERDDYFIEERVDNTPSFEDNVLNNLSSVVGSLF